jgi:hypothetical protein
MTIIILDRTYNVLRIAEKAEDLKAYRNVTVIYGVTHVAAHDNEWHDIYQGNEIVGLISDVTEVKETW